MWPLSSTQQTVLRDIYWKCLQLKNKFNGLNLLSGRKLRSTLNLSWSSIMADHKINVIIQKLQTILSIYSQFSYDCAFNYKGFMQRKYT